MITWDDLGLAWLDGVFVVPMRHALWLYDCNFPFVFVIASPCERFAEQGTRPYIFSFSGRAMGSGAYVPLFVDGHFFFRWLWFVINRSRCMGDEGMLEESNSWNTPFGSGPGRGHRSLLGYISPFSQNGHCFFFC